MCVIERGRLRDGEVVRGQAEGPLEREWEEQEEYGPSSWLEGSLSQGPCQSPFSTAERKGVCRGACG